MSRSNESRISQVLLKWFDAHRRDLPWRRTKDPYLVWVSEIMLQQTTVSMAQPYYERFVKRFPTVAALAKAPLDDVLQLWSGLGYYARARNMHRAARQIMSEFHGEFPKSAEELRKLPGIGGYTSGAIASICFDERAPALDCNVERLLARFYCIENDVRDAQTRAELNNHAYDLLSRTRPGDSNQAMIELGATVCLPGSAARCEECPLARACPAHIKGRVENLPVKPKKTRVTYEAHLVAAIEHRGEYLFQQRPHEGLWGGLWEMPSAVCRDEPPRDHIRSLLKMNGLQPAEIETEPFCRFSHQLTHRKIEFSGYRCRVSGRRARRQCWVSLGDAKKMGISTAMRRIVNSLADTSRV